MIELKEIRWPWTVEDDEFSPYVIDADRGLLTAYLPRKKVFFIASAPEMYEALDLLVKEIERIGDESREPLEDHHPDLASLKDHAKSVMAKARGE